jgi:hypothetical protein
MNDVGSRTAQESRLRIPPFGSHALAGVIALGACDQGESPQATPSSGEQTFPQPSQAPDEPKAKNAAPEIYHRDTDPTHRSAEEALLVAYAKLPVGSIAYPERLEMTQGTPSPVGVRIGMTPDVSTSGLPGHVAVALAKMSRFSVACLTASPDEFEILGIQGTPTESTICKEQGCACLRQTLVDDTADLTWSATPLVSGERKLHIRVAARLLLDGWAEEAHDVLTREGVVRIQANLWFVGRQFFEKSWAELLVSMSGLGAVVGALRQKLASRRRTERRPVGFGRVAPEPAPERQASTLRGKMQGWLLRFGRREP